MQRPSRQRQARGPRLVALAIGISLGLVTQAGAGDPILIGMNDVDQPGGPDELVRVDRLSGLASRLHVFTSSGLNYLESLAYDPRENVLWTTNDGVLVRVQPLTFAWTVVGDTGLRDIDGLAVHPTTGALYGVTYGGNDLIRIDKHDAGAVVINGAVETSARLEDLTFDPSGRLFILTSRALVEVDPQTGARLARAYLSGATSLEGLVWDPQRSTFLSAADRGSCKDVVTIDRSTGAVAFLDPALHSGFKDIEALALVPSSVVVPVALQALAAERDAEGAAVLRWLGATADLTCSVERSDWAAGPWAEIDRVRSPVAGRAGAWRYEARDAGAADADRSSRSLYYRVIATDPAGEQASVSFVLEAAPPSAVVLRPNAPNPFNPTTVFEFELPAAGSVELTIFDVQGRLLRRQAMHASGGRGALVWDGRDASGRPLAAGVYPYVLSAAGRELRGRAVLLK